MFLFVLKFTCKCGQKVVDTQKIIGPKLNLCTECEAKLKTANAEKEGTNVPKSENIHQPNQN